MEKVDRLSFYNEISRNKRNSVFLVIGILVLLILLVYIISLAVDPAYTFVILFFGIISSLIYVLISYYFSSNIALASVNARPAERSQYRIYHDVVENMTLASGLPKPKLYVMEDNQINAFATGKNPNNAVVCVTTGALNKLSKHELEGVMAHEMSHIANYDIRFMTLVAVMVGLISIISQIFLRSLWFSGGDRDNSRSNIIFLVIAIALAILTPIIVALVQLAISRKREYAADSTAVKFTRSPSGLVGALKKIKHDYKSNFKVPDAVAPLFLSKPFNSKELFSTHPPIDERIRRLERM